MKVTIYHNPRCSKSRQTLQLLQEKGIEPVVVEYLKTPPQQEQIRKILALLGIGANELVRSHEAAYGEAGLADDAGEDKLISAMAQYPILIERPIVVVDDSKAAIGRPPENVLALF